jgi:hypothetical protein
LLYIPGPVYFLIPLLVRIARKEPAKICKRLFSIIRGAVLLLRAIYRSYKALSDLLALLQALPSLTPTCKAPPFPSQALLSLILTRKPLTTCTLVRQALPSLTCPGIKANNYRNIRIYLYITPLASLSARKPVSLLVRKLLL